MYNCLFPGLKKGANCQRFRFLDLYSWTWEHCKGFGRGAFVTSRLSCVNMTCRPSMATLSVGNNKYMFSLFFVIFLLLEINMH